MVGSAEDLLRAFEAPVPVVQPDAQRGSVLGDQEVAISVSVQIADCHPCRGAAGPSLLYGDEFRRAVVEQDRVRSSIVRDDDIEIAVSVKIGETHVGERTGRKDVRENLERFIPVVEEEHGRMTVTHNDKIDVSVGIEVARSSAQTQRRCRFDGCHVEAWKRLRSPRNAKHAQHDNGGNPEDAPRWKMPTHRTKRIALHEPQCSLDPFFAPTILHPVSATPHHAFPRSGVALTHMKAVRWRLLEGTQRNATNGRENRGDDSCADLRL